jgi:2-oxo-4-hydroxy-4-carboxy-5-ureidoimidazoline decarboxylase
MSGIERLNRLAASELRDALHRCCGSDAWVERMMDARPFEGPRALFDAADRIWGSLEPRDWLQAFAAHPRIGDRTAAGWSAGEQKRALAGDGDILTELADSQRGYEVRFGHIFIVCATGKTAAEMLSMLRARLGNDPETELQTAAEEQRKITRLRLEKLLGDQELEHA